MHFSGTGNSVNNSKSIESLRLIRIRPKLIIRKRGFRRMPVQCVFFRFYISVSRDMVFAVEVVIRDVYYGIRGYIWTRQLLRDVNPVEYSVHRCSSTLRRRHVIKIFHTLWHVVKGLCLVLRDTFGPVPLHAGWKTSVYTPITITPMEPCNDHRHYYGNGPNDS